MIVTRKFDKAKTMAHNPTLVGVVAGIRFYEHPLRGDEAPLVADTGTEFGLTDFWDLPTLEDLGFEFAK